MILQFLIPKSDQTDRINYVLHFISQSLGFRYIVVSSPAKLRKTGLVLSYYQTDILDKLSNISAINIYNSGQLNTLDDLEQMVNIFDWQNESVPVLGIRLSDKENKGWRRNKTDQTYRKRESKTWSIDVDIIANIFYHLCRYEEKWRHFAEETASDHTTSLLSRYHDLKIPVVDILLGYLKSLIEKKKEKLIEILPWPGGKYLGAAFTHDVDLTRAVSLQRRLINTTYGVFKNLTGSPEIAQNLKKEMQVQDEQVWTFPELIILYTKFNIKATFFFLSKKLEGLHFRYNIRSKKFTSLLSDLIDNGHEVGLHSSLRAFDNPGRYKSEKLSLERTIGSKVMGLRQHYLRAKFPRLWRIAAAAGFTYDTSLGYNYQAGYRAGTTHPFSTFDYDRNEPIYLLEFSLVFFEHNLPDEKNNLNYISSLMDQAKKYGGLFVALLHPSNLLKEPFGDIWTNLIKKIKKNGAYIATLDEHRQWYRLREQINIAIPTKSTISITKPASIEKFSIRLHGADQIESEKSVTVEKIRPSCFMIKSKKSKILLKIG